MRIVCVSDTHNLHGKMKIPPGDLLIHAGDFTDFGEPGEIKEFNRFLGTLPHKHKVIIAGNHDTGFEYTPDEARALITNAVYLQDSMVEIGSIRIYGSPWQPVYMDDPGVFTLTPGSAMKAKWDLIPEDVDILVTHGPPWGHGDRPKTLDARGNGCRELLEAIRRVKPRYHVFGHIHVGHGITKEGDTTCVNAAALDTTGKPTHAPIIFDT